MATSRPLQTTGSVDAEDVEAAKGLPLSVSERAVFEAVYRRTCDDVMRLLRRRLGDEQDAADVMQDAYLRILRYRHLGPEPLTYLLIRTAINLAASHHVTARSRLPHVPLDGLEILEEAESLDEALDGQQRMRWTMAAACSLPDRCREVFILRLLHGLRQCEIAERCGISTRRVEQHLARAQMLIRARVRALAA